MFSLTVIKSTLQCQKMNFETLFNTTRIIQAHGEKLVPNVWTESFIPQEMIKIFERSYDECKQWQNDFEKMMNDGFSMIEYILIPK